MLVLQDAKYREAAQVLQRAIQQLNGPERAVDVIEQVLKLRTTQPLAWPASMPERMRKDAS